MKTQIMWLSASIIALAVTCFVSGWNVADKLWEDEAIKREYAEYYNGNFKTRFYLSMEDEDKIPAANGTYWRWKDNDKSKQVKERRIELQKLDKKYKEEKFLLED